MLTVKTKSVFAIMFSLLLINMLILTFNIQPIKASGTIYIRADGSVQGTDKIQRDGNVYTFTGNINDSIVVERDNIVVDGADHTVQGTGNGIGIDLSGRSNVTIRKMEIKAFGYGIYLSGSSKNSIFENNVTNNWYGIRLEESLSNTISGNNVTANDYIGIFLLRSSNNLVSGNNVTNTYECGIGLGSSSGNTISGNNIGNNGEGIGLSKSSGNVISENIKVSNNGKGIRLRKSNRNNITRNTVTNNGNGVFLQRSDYNDVNGNLLTNNTDGIILKLSTGNVLRNNNMTSNKYSLGIYGIDDDLFNLGNVYLSDYIQFIDSSNTVNGKPVYYWVNQHNRQIPINAGFVSAINCTNIRIANLTLTKNNQGILFAFTTNSTIENLNITNSNVGIQLVHSDANKVSANNITTNWWGINLYHSSHNNLTQNMVTNNDYCGIGIGRGLVGEGVIMSPIKMVPSEGNIISSNIVSNNGWYYGGLMLSNPGTKGTVVTDNYVLNNYEGIHLECLRDGCEIPSNNSIYHNNFIGNTVYIYPYDYIWYTSWDDGYPSGGNYWSDYNGTDLYSGPYQNETGSDGMADTAYVIDENNQDRYPLMAPINIFEAGTWNEVNYYVDVVSNSTVSDFHFNPDEGSFLRFNVTGEDGTAGFCRVTIPKSLLWTDSGWIINVNNETITNYREFSDNNSTYIYFAYSHSTKTVEIHGTHVIPEFPQATILPLFMIFILVVSMFRKKREMKHPKRGG